MSANDDTILARLKTQNVRGFVTDMGAASKSVLGFATANEEAAVKTRLSWVEQRAMQQAMYTGRRYAFWATTAVTGLIAASVKSGITFDENKRQATDAFTATLGSAQAARREVQLLTADTHETGLQLGDLARSAETMQSFGFSVKAANTDLLAMARYAQASRRGLSGFESLVELFDRIQQNGRFTSLDLRRLTAQGVPALQIFRRELGLTAAQMAALQNGKLIIPAQYALPALAAGLQRRSNILGTNFELELGRTHSYLAQIFGTGETGIFGFMTKGLARVNSILDRAARGQQAGGIHGLLLGIDPSGNALRYYQALAGFVRSAGQAFLFAWKLAQPFLGILMLLGDAAVALSHHTWLVSTALKVLAAWWITSRTLMVTFAAATWAVDAAETAYLITLYALDYATAAWAFTTRGAAFAMIALNLAMYANPIGVVVAALVGLAGITYLVYTHFDQLRHVAEDVWGWLVRIGRVSRIDVVVNFHIGQGQRLAHWLGVAAGNLPTVGPLIQAGMALRGLAGGGDVWSGGAALVGERGPELLTNTGGVARVTPLTSSFAGGGGMAGYSLADLVTAFHEALDGVAVKMDGIKVGEVQASAKGRKAAFA